MATLGSTTRRNTPGGTAAVTARTTLTGAALLASGAAYRASAVLGDAKVGT
jgi:hypothetical protein